VDGRDTIWVSDFGANAVLSFDPATEEWQRFPGSGENSNVRQILGANGLIYLPESGLDRIMVVDTRAQ
jgi:virginiamycin B lyase